MLIKLLSFLMGHLRTVLKRHPDIFLSRPFKHNGLLEGVGNLSAKLMYIVGVNILSAPENFPAHFAGIKSIELLEQGALSGTAGSDNADKSSVLYI